MKSILVNVAPEETRMAVIEDDELIAVEVERSSHAHLVGNVYKGRVQNVLPGMQAAFIDIGWRKNAFFYIGDDMPKSRAGKCRKLCVGQNMLIQIVKDVVGTKGPRGTASISLPGRNIVLMPTAAYIGISRRIENNAERGRLRALAEGLCPPGMGMIVRTAAAGQDEETLAEDVRYLVRLWESIMARSRLSKAPACLYRDADLIARIVRDSFTQAVDELVIDDRDAYQRIVGLVQYSSPELENRIKLYDRGTPLFGHYRIDEELRQMNDRKVPLKSGGFIVIDKTEALTAIDVNTGKYIGRANLADTVYRTNIEAAVEVLKQLRLRDIGGIILVDFIDMDSEKQQAALLETMRQLAKKDRTKTNIVDMTSLGLVEITRKKSRPNLASIVYSECPYCSGRGRILSPETVGIRICRDIRFAEQSSHAPFGYEVEVHGQVAESLRQSGLLAQLSEQLGTTIRVNARPGMHPESYAISLLEQEPFL